MGIASLLSCMHLVSRDSFLVRVNTTSRWDKNLKKSTLLKVLRTLSFDNNKPKNLLINKLIKKLIKYLDNFVVFVTNCD